MTHDETPLAELLLSQPGAHRVAPGIIAVPHVDPDPEPDPEPDPTPDAGAPDAIRYTWGH